MDANLQELCLFLTRKPPFHVCVGAYLYLEIAKLSYRNCVWMKVSRNEFLFSQRWRARKLAKIFRVASVIIRKLTDFSFSRLSLFNF